MADNIMETVAELRRLEAEATQGPWHWYSEDGSFQGLSGPDEMENHVLWCRICPRCRTEGWDCTGASRSNRGLIEAMRNALPALLDYIERKEAGRG